MRRVFTGALAVLFCSACQAPIAGPDNPTARSGQHIVYLHGAIVEDYGTQAVSDRYGPYQFDAIVEALQSSGAIVHAPVRTSGADVSDSADGAVNMIRDLIDEGVKPDDITVIGASKGAYIATLIADRTAFENVNYVLLAGCSAGVVTALQQDEVTFSGRVLAIRDRLDDRLAGSCAELVDTSPRVSDFREIVVDTGLEHGLIFTPHEAWLEPVQAWIASPDRHEFPPQAG